MEVVPGTAAEGVGANVNVGGNEAEVVVDGGGDGEAVVPGVVVVVVAVGAAADDPMRLGEGHKDWLEVVEAVPAGVVGHYVVLMVEYIAEVHSHTEGVGTHPVPSADALARVSEGAAAAAVLEVELDDRQVESNIVEDFAGLGKMKSDAGKNPDRV